MPYTSRQRAAAFAEIARRERGLHPINFKKMSLAQLKKYAHAKMEKPKKKTKRRRRGKTKKK